MQWLTAILAFATTMLIFAIIVSTIVETIHRALASRTFCLEKMLEKFYDEVLSSYAGKLLEKDSEAAKLVEAKNNFVAEMINIRGAVAPTWSITKYLSKFKMFDWQKLSSLPVVVFMEKLGRSSFSQELKKHKNKDDILKDIAQKYVAYGEESGIFFERKARSISVFVAFFVAWIFYVHPEALIKTYLENPKIAAKVAEMNEDASKNNAKVEKLLAELKKDDAQKPSELTSKEFTQLLKDLRDDLDKGKENSQLWVDAGAPIGWPADIKPTCVIKYDNSCKVSVFLPKTIRDTFWLLMGGLLIGLGAPFWAKAIGQIKQGQSAVTNVTGILKPAQAQPKAMQVMNAAPSAADDVPVTTTAFNVSASAPKPKQE